jgi:DNA-binding response OmpR family regulator
MAVHLLLVEDDQALGEVVRRGLEAHGYRVRWESEGGPAFDQACGGTFDVLVLDVMLPDMDGLDLLRGLRGAGVRTPVLCLTARGSVEDRVDGLDAGADDYLVKPFAFAELLARLRALLRRPAIDARAEALDVGNLHVDPVGHAVSVAGHDVVVPPREFDLLEYLARNQGTALSRDQIVERVWGAGAEPRGNVADATVSRLRRRLQAAGWDGAIAAVPGLGYRLQAAEGRGVERE